MKITAAPAVVSSMTMATQPPSASLNLAQPQAEAPQNLSNPDVGETEAPEATQALSPQYARIAKERRALQLQRRAFEEERRAQLNQSAGQGSIDLSRLKSRPLDVLQEAGVTYDQLTEAILASQGNAEFDALKQELNSLKEGIEKKFTDRDAQAEQQVLAEMRRDAERMVTANDSFELVRETRSIPDVMRLIERTYKETGEVLEVGEALGLVEEELFTEANRLANLNKIRSQFFPQSQEQTQPQQQQGMRTLRNRDTAPMALSRKARAMAAWNNN